MADPAQRPFEQVRYWMPPQAEQKDMANEHERARRVGRAAGKELLPEIETIRDQTDLAQPSLRQKPRKQGRLSGSDPKKVTAIKAGLIGP